MRTRTSTKFVRNLTPDEYARCARLNLRFDGYMQEDLQRERRDKDSSARVVMIKDTESDMLIAWRESLLITTLARTIADKVLVVDSSRQCRSLHLSQLLCLAMM
jgi:hypothetical protein